MRAEMGYPILVTPVSQFMASQAARNVIDPERWANVSDETVRYFLGHYGEPRPRRSIPTSPTACCRARGRRSSRQLEPLSLDGARERFGTRHLRGGAVAAADDARRAGGRDGRQRAGQPRGAGRARPGAGPAGDAAAGVGAAAARSPTCACEKGGDTVVWRRA